MGSEDDKVSSEADEIPRQSILAGMPKRSFFRVLVLLAALGGLIYLRGRTEFIAGCMANSFQVTPPTTGEPSANPARARIELRGKASAGSPQ